MRVKKINVRSNSTYDQKKLAVAVIVALNLCVVLKPYLCRFLINYDGETETETKMNATILDYSNGRTDAYEIKGDVRIQGSSSTIFVVSTGELRWNTSQIIRPHPRKPDGSAMRNVTGFTIKPGPPDTIPHCTRNLDAPAILFSTAGHMSNNFHRITDVLVPLFATSHHFHRHVIFLVSGHNPRLTSECKETLDKLSKYEIRDIDGEDEILCFPRMIVGLKAQRIGLSIDPSPSASFSMRNFTQLMRSVYSLERASVHDHRSRRPRMLVVVRSATRRLTNHVEVVDMARSLGFEPIARDFGGNMTSIAELVNTIDVMVGVHGAGLTNMVFLPENAVVLQITPLGMDYFAEICYGKAPTEEMNLKYLEYKVRVNESSLQGRYPADSEVYRDPVKICLMRGYYKCKKVFMDNQDVNLDLPRFRIILLKALDLISGRNQKVSMWGTELFLSSSPLY